MGTDGWGTDGEPRVTFDDRGRITFPKAVRERLHVDGGDDLVLDLADGEIRLRPDRPSFEPIETGRSEWGEDAFLDAGEAMVGDVEGDDGRGRRRAGGWPASSRI